jgi:hypothetical protein
MVLAVFFTARMIYYITLCMLIITEKLTRWKTCHYRFFMEKWAEKHFLDAVLHTMRFELLFQTHYLVDF